MSNDYSYIIDICTVDELGKLLIQATKVSDTSFADALRETVQGLPQPQVSLSTEQLKALDEQ